jgi:hypothetical protein
MFQACRPTGWLFYLALGMVLTSSVRGAVREEGSAARAVPAASPSPQSGPTLTDVVDTIYRADGTDAQGVLLITWPAFTEANGTAVAEGTLNVTLGASGGLNVALAPNAGANPPGVYYTVVYQLGPGQVRTEYWVVPTSSPANLAEVLGDAGERNGRARSVCAVCEHSAGGQGE